MGMAEVPGSALDGVVAAKLARLRRALHKLGRVVVAFSGGADSALLAWVANDVLGPERSLAATAVSASLAPSELADCRALALEWGLAYREVETHELSRDAYVANGTDRCWHCKDELMQALLPLAEELGRAGGSATGPGLALAEEGLGAGRGAGPAAIVLGVNVDDLGDHRPGQAAAQAAGALFPLVEAGLTKAEVRELSEALGLRTWDKPAAACLASRLPYGTPVTLGTLGTVARAEQALRDLGFRALRVRHYGELARLELALDELGRALEKRHQVVQALKSAGYRYVTLDLEGLRSGNLNHARSAGPAWAGDMGALSKAPGATKGKGAGAIKEGAIKEEVGL